MDPRKPPFALFQFFRLGSWLVGSAVEWFENGVAGSPPRDFDFVIPPVHWQEACAMVRAQGANVAINRFGGLKATIDGLEIDFWPSTVEGYLEVNNQKGPVRMLRLFPRASLTVIR